MPITKYMEMTQMHMSDTPYSYLKSKLILKDHENNVLPVTVGYLDRFFVDTWNGDADPEEYKGWKIFSKGNTFTSITSLSRIYYEGKDGNTCEGTCYLTANMALLGLQSGIVVCIPFGGWYL